ncbi:MAG TPA: glycosyltransferase, partial [Vicinamibacterales bacterium]|nr:glycosyltransferase [Vicinamibacterales bacterium]
MMRILVANEALRGGGGVETYLAAVVPALRSAGHEVGILHDNPLAEQGPQSIAPGDVWRVGVSDEGIDEAFARVRTFAPDVCFSNNMRRLEIDRRLVAQWPVVKMMHGHFGTCVSGQKAFAFPAVVPCGRSFGPACLGYYLPRRCGEARPLQIVRQYKWGLSQRSLFTQYSRIVVASRFMAEQYLHAGAEARTVQVLPLFAPPSPVAMEGGAREIDVLFVGRLTNLKGPAFAVEAAARAARRLGCPLRLVVAGEGPQRAAVEALAVARGVAAAFAGWVLPAERDRL